MRRVIARYPLEKTRGVVFAVAVSVWPRREAEHSPERGYQYQPSRRSVGQPIVAEWVCKGRCWSPKRSTNTSCSVAISRATITLQAALSHSSRSIAPTAHFLAEAEPLEQPLHGGVAQGLPVVRSRERRLSETVAARRSWTSSSRSFSAISSVFGGLPYSVPAKLPAGLC
jgi:hypothetical protein